MNNKLKEQIKDTVEVVFMALGATVVIMMVLYWVIGGSYSICIGGNCT